MQLKKSYHIATNVCSRISAITFGDLPDCLMRLSNFLTGLYDLLSIWSLFVGPHLTNNIVSDRCFIPRKHSRS